MLLLALVATGLAFFLSPPGMNVWAWYQSPTSRESPVPTQTDQLPTPSPTAWIITSTPAPETPATSGEQPPASDERGAAPLVAGGIVLAGLVPGAVVFLIRRQATEESTS